MSKFDAAWVALAAVGVCDSAGGMEYNRLLALWEESAEMIAIASFIQQYANAVPTPLQSEKDRKDGAPCKS